MDFDYKKAEEVIERAKALFSPSKEEREELLSMFESFRVELSPYFKDIRLLGSVAKGTFLKGSKELDVFVFFDKDVSKEEMGEKIFQVLRKLNINFEIRYAEHPYAKVFYKGFEIDLVPCYKIKQEERIRSAVDRSPFHYEFVSKNLKEHQKADVRVLKKLLKNFGLYGAEVGVRGFSGYLCELLIIYYGSLLELMKSSLKWKRPKLSLNKETTLDLFDEPFVFIDPTDEYRNVASSLSLENLSKFILLSSSFLRSPSLEFFEFSSLDLSFSKLKEVLGEAVVVKLKSPDVVRETKMGQLKRIERYLKSFLIKNGFLISSSFVEDREFSYIFISSLFSPPNFIIKEGPFVWMNKNAENFMEKNKAVLLGDRLFTIKEYKFKRLKEAVEKALVSYDFPSHYKGSLVDVISLNPSEIDKLSLKNRIFVEVRRNEFLFRRKV